MTNYLILDKTRFEECSPVKIWSKSKKPISVMCAVGDRWPAAVNDLPLPVGEDTMTETFATEMELVQIEEDNLILRGELRMLKIEEDKEKENEDLQNEIQRMKERRMKRAEVRLYHEVNTTKDDEVVLNSKRREARHELSNQNNSHADKLVDLNDLREIKELNEQAEKQLRARELLGRSEEE